jgi:hypothetical protein
LDSFHHETNMMDILSSNGSKREAYWIMGYGAMKWDKVFNPFLF